MRPSTFAVLLVVLSSSSFAEEPKQIEPPETSWLTVGSIGVTTYFLSSLVHEGLGHGGACLLGGGRVDALSTQVAGCSGADSRYRLVAAGGALAQTTVGAAGLATLYLAPPSTGPEYYALWLMTTVNLLQSAGYLLVFPWIPGVGDWGTGGVLRGVEPLFPAQLGVSLTGLAMTFATVMLMNGRLEPLLGRDPDGRVSRRRVLTWLPYLVGSLGVIAGSVLNRLGPDKGLGIFSATVSTLGGTLFLAYLPLFFDSDFFRVGPKSEGDAMSIKTSAPWIVAGAASLALSLLVMGPGLGGGFNEPHFLGPRP